jgi:murein DD-endopeptidase MepM/ murein hydrolase activator NlpD
MGEFRIQNDQTLSICSIMLHKQLATFIAEIFAGLPIGAAFCAVVLALVFAFVPALKPSSRDEKPSAWQRVEHRSEERIAVRLGRNETFQGLLNRFGLRPGSAQELSQKIYSSVNLRRMPRDQAINLVVDRQDRNIRVVEFVMQEHLVRASVGLAGWSVERQELAHVEGSDIVRVRITDSFARSAARAGVSVAQLAELQRVFSAEMDLLSELAAGDEVSLVVPQKQYLNGHVASAAMAAVRVVRGGRFFDAFAFNGSDGVLQYYDADGHRLPRPFLAAPLKFERISSTFDLARADPATGALRPHEAIDYQAAHGTPVVAIGSGTVEFAGSRPGNGLMVELKHAGGYTSSYSHLSRIAEGVEEGRRIKVGEAIGAVGQTGYATGPHLHFEFALDGEKLDYLSVKIPSAESLSGYQLIQFHREQAKWLAALRGSAVRVVQIPTSPWQ